ncbi:hypothetical protein RJ639_003203, partial [Escallonia herrerae]
VVGSVGYGRSLVGLWLVFSCGMSWWCLVSGGGRGFGIVGFVGGGGFVMESSIRSGGISCESSTFDPLGINSDKISGLNSALESVLGSFSQRFESASGIRKEKAASARGVAAAIEDTTIDFGDFFKGPLPGKFLKLLGYLAISRLGIYIPLGGVNREAFAGNLDQNSLLSTLDSFSGGGIGRLGICSLGIVPFINAQIVFQLLTQIYPKLQELQKREGEAGRKKILQYTRYASVGFAIVQAVGQALYLRPYVDDFSTQWVLSSVTLLTLGSVLTTYIGERISDLKLGNGTSLLIFTSIISYLPASFGRTTAEAFQDGNYVGLIAIIISFILLVLSIVYVQEAERKIPLNYASRYTSKAGGPQKSAYLPFKECPHRCCRVKEPSTGMRPFLVADSEKILIDNVHYPYAAGLLEVMPGEDLSSKEECTETYSSEFAAADFDDAIAKDLIDLELTDCAMVGCLVVRDWSRIFGDTSQLILEADDSSLRFVGEGSCEIVTASKLDGQLRGRIKLHDSGIANGIVGVDNRGVGGHYLRKAVNSSGVMPIIFSTSSLALPGTLARFTGLGVLKQAAVALNPGGAFYLPTNVLLIAFFNYYYTFLQLDPDDVSEQLKRQGASIPLVRPGKSTALFIKKVIFCLDE